ncbi:MAG TPA: discoidin domain-containing protein, partial [Kofleriaceae bacterium]
WHHRWISDDGLIFVRIARQIAAGHGPVFNPFERTEANTSALWPWLLAGFGALGGGDSSSVDFSWIAVVLGLVCSVGGLALAMDGTRRWHRARGTDAILVPASALIAIGIVPFLDFATSGLESGLSFLWLGACWWLLVAVRSRRLVLTAAFVFGLGPLVRPDLGIASIAFCIGEWLLLRPSRRRTLAMIATATALPAAYEIFRAGFYGVIVPLPALAKSATASEWRRGALYVLDVIWPFWVFVPIIVLGALFAVAVRRGAVRRERIMIAVALLAALGMGGYVMRVGGDFMQGRMLLPVAFAAALPGMVVPLRRFTAPAIAVLVVWAAVMTHTRDDDHIHVISRFAENERLGYIKWTHDPNPLEDAYVMAGTGVTSTLLGAIRHGERVFYSEGGFRPMLAAGAPSVVFAAGRLGYGGTITPLDGETVDTLGLANPVGARIELTWPTNPPGHQKVLPWAWVLADFADPAGDAAIDPLLETTANSIAAARRAEQCGDLREMLESVRAPLTAGRFFANLVGSVRRARLEIPSDPFEAELKFCGTSHAPPTVIASSSCEQWGWGKQHLTDGVRHSQGTSLGFSSAVWAPNDHTEWLELDLRGPSRVGGVTMYPRDDAGFVGAGFPIDFAIQTWDGTRWDDQLTRENVAPPPDVPQVYRFGPVTTQKIRINATKLQDVPRDGYVLQLAELEVD